jgi:hypothetical protein
MASVMLGAGPGNIPVPIDLHRLAHPGTYFARTTPALDADPRYADVHRDFRSTYANLLPQFQGGDKSTEYGTTNLPVADILGRPVGPVASARQEFEKGWIEAGPGGIKVWAHGAVIRSGRRQGLRQAPRLVWNRQG